MTRPLLIVDDADLLDELLRIAAESGTEVEVAADPVAARRGYASAPLVLVGAPLAAACVRARLSRRSGLVVVGREASGGPPFEAADALGAELVAVLPTAEPWLAARFAATTTGCRARVFAVLGGRGGAGASVLAAGLAVTAARRGRRVLLVDADPLGGGVDLVLGCQSVTGDLTVLSWDRSGPPTVPAAAMSVALDSGRASRDLVVVDLPRRLDDAAVLALSAADRVFLVVPAELRACAAASMVAAQVAAHTDALELVVRGPGPGRLRPYEVARALGLPLAGTLRREPDLARGLERGDPPAGTGRGSLAELCARLLDGLVPA